jgi:hypothetical protein
LADGELEQEHDQDTDFLGGPLFKEAGALVPTLEVYDAGLRRGAQAVGYREAAETLIEMIIGKQYPTSRALLHPLLFLYRHSVELRLKRLIEDYGTSGPSTRHELRILWPACKEIIARYTTGTEIDKAGKLIEELRDVDDSSQTFRYATTKQGAPIEIPFDVVDLVNLRKQMNDLDTFFFGLEAEMAEALRNVGQG